MCCNLYLLVQNVDIRGAFILIMRCFFFLFVLFCFVCLPVFFFFVFFLFFFLFNVLKNNNHGEIILFNSV